MFCLPLGETQSLHQLFQYHIKDVPPLRLHRLVLDTYLVRFDDITLPHLKYLTSLSLTNIKDTSDSTLKEIKADRGVGDPVYRKFGVR